MNHVRHTAFALALLLLLAVGCGEGNDDATGSASSIAEKTAFIKRADAICTKRNHAQILAIEDFNQRYNQEYSRRITEERLKEMTLTVVIPRIEKTLEKLEDMGPPEADAETFEAMIEADRKALEKAKRDPMSALDTETSPFKKGKRLSEAYGFRFCGQY